VIKVADCGVHTTFYFLQVYVEICSLSGFLLLTIFRRNFTAPLPSPLNTFCITIWASIREDFLILNTTEKLSSIYYLQMTLLFKILYTVSISLETISGIGTRIKILFLIILFIFNHFKFAKHKVNMQQL
jgi:hypothetical protein